MSEIDAARLNSFDALPDEILEQILGYVFEPESLNVVQSPFEWQPSDLHYDSHRRNARAYKNICVNRHLRDVARPLSRTSASLRNPSSQEETEVLSHLDANFVRILAISNVDFGGKLSLFKNLRQLEVVLPNENDLVCTLFENLSPVMQQLEYLSLQVQLGVACVDALAKFLPTMKSLDTLHISDMAQIHSYTPIQIELPPTLRTLGLWTFRSSLLGGCLAAGPDRPSLTSLTLSIGVPPTGSFSPSELVRRQQAHLISLTIIGYRNPNIASQVLSECDLPVLGQFAASQAFLRDWRPQHDLPALKVVCIPVSVGSISSLSFDCQHVCQRAPNLEGITLLQSADTVWSSQKTAMQALAESTALPIKICDDDLKELWQATPVGRTT